jgi:hypothetical protein
VTRANGNVKTHFKERRYASGRWLDARHQAMLCVDRSIDRYNAIHIVRRVRVAVHHSTNNSYHPS